MEIDVNFYENFAKNKESEMCLNYQEQDVSVYGCNRLQWRNHSHYVNTHAHMTSTMLLILPC